MPRRIFDDASPKHVNYSTMKNSEDLPESLEKKTLEEAAASMRNRLPGRSRKAKGRYRRQQRGERGDAFRGRLSCYCEANSYDLENLTSRLKEKHHVNGSPSRLYSNRWRVKAFFDVLHLHGLADKSSALMRFNSFRGIQSSGEPLQNNLMTETGYHTYDTEMSDGEKGNGISRLESGGLDLFGQDVLLEDDTVDIFLFSFGPVVFWGFNDAQEERAILRDLNNFVDGAFHDLKAAEDATEEMEFAYSDQNKIVNDLMELTTVKSGEKLAISSAVAQSCHLSVHEWRLMKTIERNNHIPKQLAETGLIDMNGDEISREIGRLFVERNLINLEPELLDTPEFLWNDTEFENVYRAVFRYLEIESRIEVLNKRLTIVGELLDVLRAQQEHIHANKLEYVIIILVAMEVILQLVWNILLKDVLGWVGQHDPDGL
jgi:uncharacterized Rmd1/YagE family protein